MTDCYILKVCMLPFRSAYVISFLPGLVAMLVIQDVDKLSNLLNYIPSLLKQFISPLLNPIASTCPSENQLRLIGLLFKFLVIALTEPKFLS